MLCIHKLEPHQSSASITPVKLVRGCCWLCIQNLYTNMTYQADYPIWRHYPYGDENAYTSQSDFYDGTAKLLYDFAQLRASNICKCGISKHVYTCCLICKTFHGVRLFICEGNILKLVWSQICMFLNAGHSDKDKCSHKG